MNNSRKIRRTDTGKEIESSIDSGRTIVLNNLKEAIDHVKVYKGYYYPVYVDGRTNGQYAVTK